jgi:serine/threonine protein kinase
MTRIADVAGNTIVMTDPTPTPHAPADAGDDPRAARTLVDASTGRLSTTDTPGSPADLGIHDPLHRYELGEVIGEGGMSVVRRVTDISLRRPMALKHSRDDASDTTVMRLVREARITAQLQHPGIAPVYELSQDADGNVFYTMSLIEGQSLGEILKAKGHGDEKTITDFPLPRLLTVYQRICDAIAFAHSRGVIHRDLKPDNIMVGPFGSVLVIDWGVAKVLGDEGEREGDTGDTTPGIGNHTADDAELTRAGALVGTPRYMAPEQVAGNPDDVDERTDIYGLGGVLYSILTGHPPVVGKDTADTLTRVVQGSIPHPDTYAPGRVPDSLTSVAMKALALKPQGRYQSVRDLQTDIEAYQNGFATSVEAVSLWKQVKFFVKRNRTASIAAGIVLTAVIAGGGVATMQWLRAERNFHALKDTAPDLITASERFVAQGDLAGAVRRAELAVSLVPTNTAYVTRLGNLLQASLRLTEAVGVYDTLRDDPEAHAARTNRALCEKLLSEYGDTEEPRPAMISQLHSFLWEQKRHKQASAMVRTFGADAGTLEPTYRSLLTEQGVEIKSLEVAEGGLCKLDLSNTDISDLTPLEDLPIQTLDLNGNRRITNITSLSGMPLEVLSLKRTAVADLSPLADMHLQVLNIADNKVISDLSPLSDLQLRQFTMYGCDSVSNISIIAGMPLETLVISTGNARMHLEDRDFAHLADLPLRCLHLNTQRNITHLSPLRGMKLEVLDMAGCVRVRDISVLEGMPLRHLRMTGLLVSDISVLKDMPLRHLEMSRCERVNDISPLRGMPLEKLKIDGTGVTNVSVISEMRTLRELYWNSDAQRSLLAPFHKAVTDGDFRSAASETRRVLEEWGDVPAEPVRRICRAAEYFRRRLAAIAQLAESPDTIPSQAAELNGHHYLICPLTLDWESALSWCVAHGGHLATLETREEIAFIDKEVNVSGVRSIWIGGRSGEWVTGKPVDDAVYPRTGRERAHWGPGQAAAYNARKNATGVQETRADDFTGLALRRATESRPFVIEWER